MFGRLVRTLTRGLLQDRRGNVAMIAAITFPVIFLTGAFAVDLNRVHSARAAAQSAVDAAALGAASSGRTDAKELDKIALDYLEGNLDYRYLRRGHTDKVTFEDDTTLTVHLKGDVQTIFAGLIGIPYLNVDVTATALRGTADQIELALVLDNTWSMSATAGGGVKKIDALKTAAKSLVDVLLVRPDGSVRIGVVPYGDYVNVGTATRGASWLNVAPDYQTTSTNTVDEVCTTTEVRKTCAPSTPKTCERFYDGVPETYSCPIAGACTEKTVTIPKKCTPAKTTTTITRYKWYGCVGSRMVGNNRRTDQGSERYPGFLTTSQLCLNPLTVLTDQKATVTAAINDLIINIGGYKPETYIPSGMIWGINILSPTAPFTEGRVYGEVNRNPRKIIVLMTDGENTIRFNAANGQHVALSGNATQKAAQAKQTDDDTRALCAYAKSQNIEIYTVALAVNSAPARALLETCATDSEHYFDARDNAALNRAFANIAASIYRVRLIR